MFSKISGPLWPRDRPVGIGSRKGDVATTEKPIEALAFISTASTGQSEREEEHWKCPCVSSTSSRFFGGRLDLEPPSPNHCVPPSSNKDGSSPTLIMCSKATVESPAPASTPSCAEAVGNKVDHSIVSFFLKVGRFCSYRPKTTIALALAIAVACAGGMSQLTTESRPDKVLMLALIAVASFVRCLTHSDRSLALPAMGAAEHRGGKGTGCISIILPSQLAVRKCHCLGES